MSTVREPSDAAVTRTMKKWHAYAEVSIVAVSLSDGLTVVSSCPSVENSSIRQSGAVEVMVRLIPWNIAVREFPVPVSVGSMPVAEIEKSCHWGVARNAFSSDGAILSLTFG